MSGRRVICMEKQIRVIDGSRMVRNLSLIAWKELEHKCGRYILKSRYISRYLINF